MKPGARRRRSLVLVAVSAVAVFGGTWAVAFFARPEHVVRLTAQVAVAANGSAQVDEAIAYRFSGIGHHGIYRDVPGLAADAPGVTATDNGRPAPVLVTSDEIALPEAHIRVGDPGRTVSGDHAYLVSYPLPTVIDVNGNLDWNGVGTGWAVDIDQADLDVTGPWTWVDPTCHQGAEGSTTPCTVTQPVPGRLVVHVGHLAPHQGVTVEAARGSALTAAPDLPAPPPVQWPPQGTSPLLTAAIAASAVLVAAIALRGLLERLGRDEVVGDGATEVAFAGAPLAAGDAASTSARRVGGRELTGMAAIEFAPPADLTAWQGGVLCAEQVLDEHKVAWLLEAAIAGHLQLDEQDGKVALTRLAARAPAPVVAPGQPAAPGAALDALLDVGFAGRPVIVLGSYDPSFAAMWKRLDADLTGWMATSSLWEPRGRRRQRIARVAGGLLTLVGLAGLAGAAVVVARNGSGHLGLVAAAGLVTGLGLAALSAAFELMVRTPQGSGLWVRVESFRRFLHDSEGPQAEDAAERGVLRQYTAWAIALDEVHHWSKAVEAAGAQIGTVDRAGLGYVYLAPMLVSSAHSASVAPRSSGAGGVGGAVGGGFGGGGGGSW